ncbi:hypothetical protein N7454_002149 [Penicillium verhagenii]|nr:hypothetical protein N7454_002149 [Penicillium verhagenii]
MGGQPHTKHISDEPFTLKNWYQHFNWLYVTHLILVPLFGFIQAARTPAYTKTLVLSLVFYSISGLCITAGYHRLWAHRAYSATGPLRLFFAIFGAGALAGSIKHWSREHRAHHRYTDTEKDPYDARKGVIHAHILWLILKSPRKYWSVDISDLENDPIVLWQHRLYLPLGFFMGWIFPSIVAGLCWHDWLGGFVYAGILRVFFLHQAIFCVNSLAHFLGTQTYDDQHTPRDHILTALITFGEGYHNFHHQFPSDYRNGVDWYQIDTTKWLIWLLSKVYLAGDLKRFQQKFIEQGRIRMLYAAVDKRRNKISWGRPLHELPIIEWTEYQERISQGCKLILIEGIVHDISNLIEEHPGGEQILKSRIGTDATAAFNGGIYRHSQAARNLLADARLAVLRGGCEVEGSLHTVS